MIIAILTVWGGLALALLNLKRHPEDEARCRRSTHRSFDRRIQCLGPGVWHSVP
ncbi:methionine/alanine import family NSS transporter small subunit [Arthrobacter sp. OVS8]|nr:methionine/alanine import family NSS transporter small subunit [Arthrobacter sp. OVS8]